MRLRFAILGLALVASGITGCAEKAGDAVVLGGQDVQVFVADSDEERSNGLQGYDGLEDGEGMLFVFDDLAVRYFTMKDVSFPIDVVFFAEDLTVSAIVPLEPGGADVIGSPGPSPYVLELPQGWAEEHDIAVGSTLEVPSALER